MAGVHAALIAALTSDAGVTALVGTRVFPKGARQSEDYPYVTTFHVSTPGARHLGGPTTLEWPRFQIEAWAKTELEAEIVAEAIRLAIDRITIPGNPTISPDFEDQGAMPPDSETRSFGHRQDYFIYYNR